MNLAFLDALRFDGGAVRGAVLVTDERTRPLEFRVTDPVVASDLQRVLYGAVLDEHVLGDLCGVPLLEALREDVHFVLVRDQALLSLQDLRDELVFWIGRDEDADPPEDGRPLGVVMGYHGDGEEPAIKTARLELREIARHYDLLEPFERMAEAVRHVHRGEGQAAAS